ncbi:MAG: hypothetical protein K5637_08105 [Lachnospiraceae bacterium]|nr:hypothetical protein [Lachnospiraceae bacterium]
MKRAYETPFFLNAEGIITMTVSQAANMGLGNIAEWNEWYTEFEDLIEKAFPEFNVLDRDTWPEGFEQSDPGTWEILLGDDWG